MFGATAAVYSFNRLSRSLWFLMCKMLVIPSAVFYDDFPLLSPRETADSADECASALLDLLGWRHALRIFFLSLGSDYGSIPSTRGGSDFEQQAGED